MAITSIGYPNTIAPGSATALWHAAAGRPYVFPAENQVKPNNPAIGTRRVTLSAGRFSGKGITDYNDAVVNLDLPAPVGSSQWFAIVANRWVDPASTPATPIPSGTATRFGWVAGTATKAIPAVTQNAGTFDQQLIALALVESGQQYIRQLVDLRAIGDEGGVYTIFDEMALQTITRPGARAYNPVTGITYECVYTAGLALEWRVVDSPLIGMTGNGGTAAPGWYGASEATLNNYRYLRSSSRGGRDLELYLRLRLNSGSVAPAADGSFTGTPTIFTLDPAYRPLFMYPFVLTYRTTTGGVRSGVGRVSPEGLVQLVSGTPGDPIDSFTVAQGYSVMAQLRHTIV